jgi:positive regulator of sigma E activity
VSNEVRAFAIRAKVLKSGLLSFYLLFLVIILFCSICVHYSLFLLSSYLVPFVFIIPYFCFVSWTKLKRKKKKRERCQKRKENKKGGVDF